MATNKTEVPASTTPANSATPEVKKKTGTAARGFASMNPERQREIASLGGKASHASGNAHEFTSEEARAAGSKSRSGKRAAVSAVPAEAPSTSQTTSQSPKPAV